MIAVASIVGGLAAGYLIRERLRAYAVWFSVWWVALLVQTLTVIRDQDRLGYWVAVTAILGLGILMVWLGGRLRRRRDSRG